jgi:hypothetical protein
LWRVRSCPCFWFLPNTPPGKQTSIRLIDASCQHLCIVFFLTTTGPKVRAYTGYCISWMCQLLLMFSCLFLF